MNQTTMTCILCPNGCELTVRWIEEETGPEVVEVTGNLCVKGKDYAVEEITAPKRTMTTTVRVKGGERPLVSVRTAHPIPKKSIRDCLDELRFIVIAAPVQIGETIVENVAGTDTVVLATRNVKNRVRTGDENKEESASGSAD